MVFLKLSLLPYIPHIFFLNHNDLYRPILPEFVEVIKATDLRLLKQSEAGSFCYRRFLASFCYTHDSSYP